MAIVSLIDGDARLVLRAGVLTVERGGEAHALVLDQIDEVQLHAGADLSPAARGLLLREGVDVAFFSRDGRYLGRLQAAGSRTAARRFAWYRLCSSPVWSLDLARQVITAKIHNQRAILLVRQRRVRSTVVADRLTQLRALRADVQRAPSAASLLGIEGAAAAAHYAAMGELNSNPDLPFRGRNRRPPKDGFNAALSYGYALLCSRVEQAIARAGLDPGLGVLHSAERGAPALALDLMEPLRPVVDDMVLTLVNRRQLQPGDLRSPAEDPDAGLEAELDPSAVLLNRLGRAVLLQAWSRTLASPHRHPTEDRRAPFEQLILDTARQLAALVEGRTQTWHPLLLET
jgi:CRISP-associated protein Cas1